MVLAILAALAISLTDTLEARQRLLRAQEQGVPPSGWQLGARQQERYQRFLHAVADTLPKDSRVAVLGPGEAPRSEATFFLSLWTAWHQPRWRVLRRPSAEGREQADAWITYRRHLKAPTLRIHGLEEVARHPLGAVYRRAQPSDSGLREDLAQENPTQDEPIQEEPTTDGGGS